MLVLGTVVISGCTTTQKNNTSGNSQNKSPSIPGYSIGQIIKMESFNNEISSVSGGDSCSWFRY